MSEKSLRYIRLFRRFPYQYHFTIYGLRTTWRLVDSTKPMLSKHAKSVIRTLHPHDHRPRRSRPRPTCGSGTTAYVAEQWGRRWITIDTSRVALALARARIMGARYPYYLLADSRDGQLKEA